MELKVLSKDKYIVAAVTNRGNCEIEEKLTDGNEDETYAWRVRLLQMLSDIGSDGLDTEHIYSKCVNKTNKIYELKSGKLRLFYFKGSNNLIIVCTSLSRKTSQKVNQAEVERAIKYKNEFERANDVDDIKLLGD